MPIKVWPVFPVFCENRFLALCEAAGCDDFDIGIILGPRRSKPLVDARMAIAGVLRREGYSLTDIGRAMNRDHSSIVNLLKRANKSNKKQ